MKEVILILFAVSWYSSLIAQTDSITINGIILNEGSKEPLEFVDISDSNNFLLGESDEHGHFHFKYPANESQSINFNRIDLEDKTLRTDELLKSLPCTILLKSKILDLDIVITESQFENIGFATDNLKNLNHLPITAGNIESYLGAIAMGVNSGTGGEISSSYNVRGGNYDENLTFINDFEILAPQLVLNSNQEGITIPNSNGINKISFSSGGFTSEYGDKMSSLMKVNYGSKGESKLGVNLSLIENSLHYSNEIKADNRKLFYFLGFRHKTNRTFVSSFDVSGDYSSKAFDFQAFSKITWNNNLSTEIFFDNNLNSSSLLPRFRETRANFSDIINTQTLQLTTTFDGEEKLNIDQSFMGISFLFIPREKNPKSFFKLVGSHQKINELNNRDILTFYDLQDVDRRFLSPTFGQVFNTFASGTNHHFFNSSLFSSVQNIKINGANLFSLRTATESSILFKYGLSYKSLRHVGEQKEWIRDNHKGYIQPFDPLSIPINFQNEFGSTIHSDFLSGYLQSKLTYYDFHRNQLAINFGVRGEWSSLNKLGYLTPRLQIAFKPVYDIHNTIYKLSTGFYYQSPYYKEIVNRSSTIDLNILPQKSFQIYAGVIRDIGFSERPFQLEGEIFYKNLWDNIPYDIDGVRILYYDQNNLKGETFGVDLKLRGNFTDTAETWITLSFLKARESIENIEHKTISANGQFRILKFVPRPNDRTLNLSIFLQDGFRNTDFFKFYLNYLWSSGNPYGPRFNNLEFRNSFRFPSTNQVNLGFLFELIDKTDSESNKNLKLNFSIINLLNIRNATSNFEIELDDQRRVFIPNYLTSRLFNLKISMTLK